MMGLLDRDGQRIIKPGEGLDRLLAGPQRKVFEGEVDVRFYDDAAEATGDCAHCGGTVTYLTRFRAGSVVTPADEKRVLDHLYTGIQVRHQCTTLVADKIDFEEFVRRLH